MSRAAPFLFAASVLWGGACSSSNTGSVVLQWTFVGGNGAALQCNAAAVQQVRVQVQSTSQVYLFPCFAWGGGETGGGGAGQNQGEIDDLPVGNQSFIVSGMSFAYDGNGDLTGQAATYQGSFSVQVAQGIARQAPVNVQSTQTSAASNSNTVFLWTFGGKTCSQAGGPQVTLMIEDPVAGNTTAQVACDQAGVDGVEVGADPQTGQVGYTAGSYQFTLTAASGTSTYYASGTFSANGVSDTVVHADLQAQSGTSTPAQGTGSAQVDLTFGEQACDGAGLSNVQVFVVDAFGRLVQQSELTASCSDLPLTIQGLTAPGTYFLNAVGLQGNTDAYSLLQYELTAYPNRTAIYDADVPLTASL